MRNAIGLAGLAVCLLGGLLIGPVFAGTLAAADCDPPQCWGAIATSDSTGHWAYSLNLPDKSAAEAAAVRDCSEADCTVRGACAEGGGAVAPGAGWAAGGRGQPRDGAEAEAMDSCGADGCRIATATCTGPD